MKPHRDAAALAASLTNAAAAPLPLPERAAAPVVAMPQRTEAPPKAEAPQPKTPGKAKVVADTVGITLRPERELLTRYTNAAAARTVKEGRVVSAQEIMLEVLERGRPQVQA
ncbi:MAG: hypothetical protein ACRD36_10430 [Candidatus Acidiferrum sp.]